MEVTKERMLNLISMLLHDTTRVRWPEEFLSVIYDLVIENSATTPVQKLAVMLDLCMAYDEYEIRTVNWVRRAAGLV